MNHFSQKSLLGKVYKTILDNDLITDGDRVVVALSGGADSVTLLYALLELKTKLNIQVSVCHFNHRLRGQESDTDEKFVADLCQKLNIECTVGRAGKSGEYKSEDSARQARYAFFEKILQEGRGDKLAIAHNLNDQAETVLMRLIRGTGIRGLKSIPYRRKFFIRPLLDISRSEIEAHIADNQLAFVTDQTNFSPKYLRNDVRNDLLPSLTRLNPNILNTLANISKNVSVDYDLIEELAKTETKKLTISENEHEIILDYCGWKALHPALQSMVLRQGLASLESLDDITSIQLDEAASMLKKGFGRKHKVLPHSLRIELIGGKIILSKK